MKSCCREAFEQDPTQSEKTTVKNRLQQLQQKWGLQNNFQVILIISTFAIGGSLAGLGGRKILAVGAVENNTLWLPLYIILVTLLWPVCVLTVGTLLGQRRFFLQFLGRLSKKIKPRRLNSK